MTPRVTADQAASAARAITLAAHSDLSHIRRRAAALWIDDAGSLRIGRSGCLVTMLDDLAVRSRP
jgi:hypothetical protein